MKIMKTRKNKHQFIAWFYIPRWLQNEIVSIKFQAAIYGLQEAKLNEHVNVWFIFMFPYLTLSLQL